MIQYCKTILSKVSFNGQLFERELRKYTRYLNGNEYKELLNWCSENFEGALKKITQEVALERVKA